MRDNEIYTVLIAQLDAGYARMGAPVTTLQLNQPTTQGADLGPVLYVTKLFDRRVGSPQRKEILDDTDPLNMFFRHEERQWINSTFQASGVFKQTAADVAGWTASDVANFGAAILQSDATMAAMRAAGLGILRIPDIRNPYAVNGQEQFEAFPNFDFVLTHEQITVAETPVLSAQEVEIHRV